MKTTEEKLRALRKQEFLNKVYGTKPKVIRTKKQIAKAKAKAKVKAQKEADKALKLFYKNRVLEGAEVRLSETIFPHQPYSKSRRKCRNSTKNIDLNRLYERGVERAYSWNQG